MKKRRLAVVAFLSVSLSACGGGGSDEAAPTTTVPASTTTTLPPGQLTKTQADAALLTAVELGAGYVEEPAKATNRDPSGYKPADDMKYATLDAPMSTQKTFTRGRSTTRVDILERIAATPDAGKILDTYRTSIINQCANYTARSGTDSVPVKIVPLAVSTFGDDTVAMRATIDAGSGVKLYSDNVVVRKANNLIVITVSTAVPNTESALTTLVKGAVDKVTKQTAA